ncbi:hypothetical protein COHA_003500 [Chlorella ohadii]|uniref:Uncharacterized protein n=1 Tax=Chlorella ohadii TaxID=2649997 RepID=A0AAD5H3F7_9CHLO|nr:hypothetical protein COHA_003500 [Chlorella ohadii]
MFQWAQLMVWSALWLARRSLAQNENIPGFTVGGITISPVKFVDEEAPKKWWFWLIIGLVAAFCIVILFFVWRGWKQWKLNKARTAAYEEEQAKQQEEAEKGEAEAAAAAPAGPTAGVGAPPLPGGLPPFARADPGQIELAGMPGRPVSEAERAAWLAERERRTAVHPRRKW